MRCAAETLDKEQPMKEKRCVALPKPLTKNTPYKACSAFTRVTACTLALSPYIVTRYPKASAISLPPWLLRLLPAGAVAGWDLHPLESAAFPRRTPGADFPGPPSARKIGLAIGLFAQSDFGPDPLDFRFILRAEYSVCQLDRDLL